VLSRDGRKITQLLKKRKKILVPIPDIPNLIDFLYEIPRSAQRHNAGKRKLIAGRINCAGHPGLTAAGSRL